MKPRSKFQSLLFAFAACVILFSPSASVAQQPPAKPAAPRRELKPEEREWLDSRTVKKITPPSGTGFYIEALASPPGRYSMSLSDGEGHSMSDSFTQTQVDIFEAIMIEAKKFAQTDQNVGTARHMITRFFDRQEPGIFVDVLKQGQQSRFFITIKSVTGKATIDAGAIKRGDQEANPLFYDILSRVQAAKANAPVSR
ncbi:MAG TPA: hypothetical protein VID27_11770 [Blastocatellia bacterium]|jgi:hypothetical protein